ncbi:TonB-dependent receptor [Catalinimonas sp. 4WD22]|uniref:SusC/RagA family TonB-linked outer membrane protein n=1 Tax=Catalinimonas locisalis TaxID=3133978 RepID=UPI0031013B96
MHKSSQSKLLLVCWLLLMFSSLPQAWSQVRTINGTITDQSNGSPLPGVNILVKGTTNGTITDIEGKFSLSVQSDNPVLIVSSIGYLSQEIEVDNRNQIDVQLTEDVASLEEVVVVGYGTQKKSNITGAIASVSGEDLEKVQVASFDQAIQGLAAGVYVTSNSGQPGGGISVRIRGIGAINNSNPLYVIDGVIVGAGNSETTNPLASLNPNDIESVEVLKDAASAAIYGARAANGVVLITTKRGSTGQPTLSYNGYYGLQVPTTNLPRPLNAQEFAENMNQAFTAAGQDAPFDNPAALGEGTNWKDVLMRNGNIQDHQLSLSGGNEKHNYFVSANYFNNQGIMIETFHERMSFRVNTDNQLSDKWSVGNSLAFSRTSRYDNGSGNRTFIHGSFTEIYQMLPTQPVYNDDGTFAGPTDTRLERRRNAASRELLPERDNVENRLLGNLYVNFEPIKGLTFRTSFSTDIVGRNTYFFEPPYHEGLLEDLYSNVNRSAVNSTFWLWENFATYQKALGQHNFSLMVGTSAQNFDIRSISANAEYDSDAFTEVTNSALINNSTTSFTEESLASVFGRLTYNFDERYLLTANVRRDGSSKFGPNNKFGVFPSFSAGWRISEENFFDSQLVNDLKLRGGWGQVGSDAIGNFKYLAALNTGFNYPFGNQTGSSSLGAALLELGNPNIQWETATEWSIGADVGLLDNRLTFTADYFEKTRTDMLLTLPLAGISGLTQTVDNVGELLNKGFEFSTNYRKATGKFTYDIGLNFTTFYNEVVDIDILNEIVASTYSGSGAVALIRVGQPLGVFYGLVTEGLFQTPEEVRQANAVDGDESTPFQLSDTAPGDFRYRDLNGDGRITGDDRQIIGSPVPDFSYGINGSLQYGNFDLNFQLFGVQGNEILNLGRSIRESSGRAFNKSSTVVNAWNGPGSSNSIPRPIVTDPNQNVRVGTHLVEDGSFLRLRNLQLGYNLSPELLSSLGITRLRAYIAGQNLLTFTNYSGNDPEIGFDGNNTAANGLDQDLYPQARTYTIGVNVSF